MKKFTEKELDEVISISHVDNTVVLKNQLKNILDIFNEKIGNLYVLSIRITPGGNYNEFANCYFTLKYNNDDALFEYSNLFVLSFMICVNTWANKIVCSAIKYYEFNFETFSRMYTYCDFKRHKKINNSCLTLRNHKFNLKTEDFVNIVEFLNKIDEKITTDLETIHQMFNDIISIDSQISEMRNQINLKEMEVNSMKNQLMFLCDKQEQLFHKKIKMLGDF